ncbi:MAG: hypothetical protein QJR00_07155 [Bacillota bacterium]|nr:hypothetical protein [Bacillota bacterium]
MTLWVWGDEARLEEAGRMLQERGFPVAQGPGGSPRAGDHLLLPPAPLKELPPLEAEGLTLWAGLLAPDLAGRVRERGWRHVSYGEDPFFQRENGRLTAESFLLWFMGEEKRSLREVGWAVLGLGRTGRPLLERICSWEGRGLGVTGRPQDHQDLVAKGVPILPWEAFHPSRLGVEAVVNTAPARVLPKARLGELQGTFFFELASSPYALEEDEAGRLGIDYRRLPSLPARVLTRSAARLLARTVIRLWPEEGGGLWTRS